MDPEQVGKLWENRFQKMLQLEDDSLQFYRDLAKQMEAGNGNAKFAELLNEILSDESEHTAICRELLKLVEHQRQRWGKIEENHGV